MTDLDTTTFNTPNGFVTTDFDAIPTINSISIGTVIVLQPDGKIVMAGKFYDSVSGLQVVAVCRYLSSGTLDLSFGGSGTGKVTVQLNTGTTDGVSGIALQSDGKIVICGYQVFPFSFGPPIIPATSNIFVLRLTTSGILDTGVGGFNLGSVGGAAPGYLYTTPADFTSVFSPSLSSTNCSAEAIAMQTIGANEFIVVGGSASMYQPAISSTAVAYYALARYTLSGSPDLTFGSSGLVVQSFLPLRDHFGIDLYVDSTQILLAGVKYYTPPVNVTTRMTVVKFNGGGILDSTWGTNGNGLTDIPNFFIHSQDSANAIRVQTNGYIILGGTSTNNDLPYQQRCFVLARLLPTGGLDASYGSGGVVITDLSPAYNLYANAMVIQPDDKIVLGGTWDILGTSPASFALARYDAAGILAGTLDTTFGIAGTGLILEDLLPNPGYVEEGYSLAIQPDGKIIMGGVLNENQNESGPQRFILARYLSVPTPPTPTPIVPICFPAGTPVLTDQGNVCIEKIEPGKNTIRGKEIIAITKTRSPFNKLVCFNKGSLGRNVPSEITLISFEHGIVYNRRLIPAFKFAHKMPGIYYVQYNHQYLYNVLLKHHFYMMVNDMMVETLNPSNIVAKMITCKQNENEKTRLICKINEDAIKKMKKITSMPVLHNMHRYYTVNNKQMYKMQACHPIFNKFINTRRIHDEVKRRANYTRNAYSYHNSPKTHNFYNALNPANKRIHMFSLKRRAK
jgi:uncharacterized delta-60 repeat protein